MGKVVATDRAGFELDRRSVGGGHVRRMSEHGLFVSADKVELRMQREPGVERPDVLRATGRRRRAGRAREGDAMARRPRLAAGAGDAGSSMSFARSASSPGTCVRASSRACVATRAFPELRSRRRPGLAERPRAQVAGHVQDRHGGPELAHFADKRGAGGARHACFRRLRPHRTGRDRRETRRAPQRLKSLHGETIPTTHSEFNRRVAFHAAFKRVLSREQLLERSRLHDGEVSDRSADGPAGRRRKQLEPKGAPTQLLRTERGAGYVFTANVETVR